MLRGLPAQLQSNAIGFLRGGGGGWEGAVTLLKTHLKDEYSHEHTIHNAERPGPFYRYAN